MQQIQKRNGQVTNFDINKIYKAIFKSLEASGQPNFDLAKELGNKVQKKLFSAISHNRIPKVEEIQDIVEQMLVSEGQAKTAKAFILYRQKRSDIRQQKKQLLNKEDIDDIDKQFDLNSLRVLCSRYLKKDEDGKVIESPRQLFERVATHTALPSILFDEILFNKQGGKTTHPFEEFDQKEYAGKIKIGKYTLNQFHLKAVKMMYDRFNKKGQMKKSFSEVFAMIKNGQLNKYEAEITEYFNLMTTRKFLPNTPAIINFGGPLGMGSACFVLPIEDSIESIMDALAKSAVVFKSGGGMGYNFSKLRPEGDFIKSTGGTSSGPLSFMSLFDKMTDIIKQGGVRRGASMGIMNSDHPDIEKFITVKRGNQALKNFNISVFIKSDFWEHYETNKPYPLRNPKNNEIIKYIDPQNFLNLIVYQAWESGEPGVIFDDHINKHNPFFKTLGPIECTNPCGEIPLFPYGSCNLGSINVWSFCKSKPSNGYQKNVWFDWDEFKKVIKITTKFLDNVIEVNKFPLPKIEEMSLGMRRIGLGMMGMANVLYELELSYNSSEGLKFMEKLMEFLNYHSKVVSVILAKERGKFPYYDKSFYQEGKLPFRGREIASGELPLENKENLEQVLDWDLLKEQIQKYGLRNAQTTTNAPTGSISMIAGCSSGIEPNFSLVFEKKITIGSFYYVNPIFEQAMAREGLLDEELIKQVSDDRGSVQNLSYIPPHLKKVFVTAMDLSAEDHIKALSILQRWTDSAISKTINFPSTATVDDMKKAYLLGHELECKGLTVFRDQSIQGVLSTGPKNKKPEQADKPKSEKLVREKDEKAKGPVIYHDANLDTPPPFQNNNNGNNCPNCSTLLIRVEGCKKCPKCSWGICTG